MWLTIHLNDGVVDFDSLGWWEGGKAAYGRTDDDEAGGKREMNTVESPLMREADRARVSTW